MAKESAQILKELGLEVNETTGKYDEEDLLELLKEYVTIKDSEVNAVKGISVKSLPTVVKNQEELVKRKMYGIVTDENNGVVSMMNKRNAIITTLIDILKENIDETKNQLGNIRNIGTITTLDDLNDYTTNGTYTFTYSGKECLMLVAGEIGSIQCEQIIFGRHGADNLTVVVRTKMNDTWQTNENEIAYKNEVDKINDNLKKYVTLTGTNTLTGVNTFNSTQKMSDIRPRLNNRYNLGIEGANWDYIYVNTISNGKEEISVNHIASTEYVDNKFKQLFGEGQVEKTLDTIAEISRALEENVGVVEKLDESITNKADKTEVNAVKDLLSELNIYDYVVSNNPYVEDDTLYLENGYVRDGTLYLKNAKVENGVLYIDYIE